MISGAQNLPVQISISRADGKIMHSERIFAGSDKVPYYWSGVTGNRNKLSSGVYFLRIETPRQATVTRIPYFN